MSCYQTSQSPGRRTLSCFLAEKGQDLLEYALIFPLVLTLMLAIVEFGRLIFTYDTIANAAREGARYASIAYNDPGVGDGVRSVALKLTAGVVCDLGKPPYVPDPVVDKVNGKVQVTVHCDLTMIVGEIFGDSGRPMFPLEAVAIMNVE